MPTKGRPLARRFRNAATQRASQWLAIRVELVEGRGETFTKPAGRLLAVSHGHTFAEFAKQIDIAFARWDLGHLYEFVLPGGLRIGPLDADDEDQLDADVEKVGRLEPKSRFMYTFDLGDSWLHQCTVEEFIDPIEVLGVIPKLPTAFFGWGTIPDQHGRVGADE